MNLFALSPTQQAGGQIALAAVLGIVGLYLLLPRPRGRFVPGGIAALIAAAAVFAAWVVGTFGRPLPDLLGTALFWLFAGGALVFGTVLVVQRNPARGAIAFAFVILSVCGLFLLLAAPFLMAATIIIYAGAIIVTFMFVLMLSQAGVSDENDRTREPAVRQLRRVRVHRPRPLHPVPDEPGRRAGRARPHRHAAGAPAQPGGHRRRAQGSRRRRPSAGSGRGVARRGVGHASERVQKAEEIEAIETTSRRWWAPRRRISSRWCRTGRCGRGWRRRPGPARDERACCTARTSRPAPPSAGPKPCATPRSRT
jgi:hypothetical protein